MKIQNKFRLLSILMMILIICSCYIIKQVQYQEEQREYYQSKAIEYLYEKYGQYPEYVIGGNYYDSVYFFNSYYSENDIKFQVRYITASFVFEDDYIKNSLKSELKNMIIEKLSENNITGVDLVVGSMVGPPNTLKKRLDAYYQNLGRLPHIEDIDHNEMFSYVYISSIDEKWNDAKKNKITKIIKEMNLPVETIDLRTDTAD